MTYVNIGGDRMPDMRYSHALSLVLALAREEGPGGLAPAFGRSEDEMTQAQKTSLDLLTDLQDRFVDLDNVFRMPEADLPFDEAMMARDVDAVSTDPAEAFKFALDMAGRRDEAMDLAGWGTRAESNQRSQAMEIVRDLVHKHGPEVAAVLSEPTSVPRL